MPVEEPVALWSCPRCGEQRRTDVPLCLRCGAEAPVFPVPARRCPGCGTEASEAAREGHFHCVQCGRDFEDYEEWVRRCRAAAWAAIRPVPPPPETPPPLPEHLTPIGASLLLMAVFYAVSGFLLGRVWLLIPCLALALLQALAGMSLIAKKRHSDMLVRFAAGMSALLPLFVLPGIYFVALFSRFSQPPVVRYFGGGLDPVSDRFRHPLLAWMIVVLGVVAGLFATVVAGALETAQHWNDTLSPLMDVGKGVSLFFVENAWWAPAGLLGGLCVLGLWGKVDRHGFLAVSILVLAAMVSVGVPPAVDAWMYQKAAHEAEAYRGERDVQRLLWGAREPDPKARIASLQAMEQVGRQARVMVPALVRALQDPDRRVRLSAACTLAQFDPSVDEALLILFGALEDDRSTAEERSRAAQALANYGPRSRPALPRLLDLLRRGDSATLVLAEMGAAAIPGLTEALTDKDAAVRRRASGALRQIGPLARSAVPLLIDRLRDSDPDVRREAAAALGEVHREKAVPLLREVLLQDKGTAKAAAEALAALGQRDGLAELPQGSPTLNALRQPAIWDHLSRAIIDKDAEGTGSEILVELAERAVMCADIGPEVAEHPGLTAFRRIFASTRKRSVLEVLKSLGVDFILESDRIRVVTPEQSRAFWTEWLAEQRKKRE